MFSLAVLPPVAWRRSTASGLAESSVSARRRRSSSRSLMRRGGPSAGRCFVLLSGGAAGCEQHGHVATFLQGGLLHDADLRDVLEKPVEEHPPTLGVALLAAAEHDRHLDLVLLLQE